MERNICCFQQNNDSSELWLTESDSSFPRTDCESTNTRIRVKATDSCRYTSHLHSTARQRTPLPPPPHKSVWISSHISSLHINLMSLISKSKTARTIKQTVYRTCNNKMTSSSAPTIDFCNNVFQDQAMFTSRSLDTWPAAVNLCL